MVDSLLVKKRVELRLYSENSEMMLDASWT